METRLVKINNMEDCKKDMEEAGRADQRWRTCCISTETVYGLGGNDYFLMRQRRSMQRREDLLIIH